MISVSLSHLYHDHKLAGDEPQDAATPANTFTASAIPPSLLATLTIALHSRPRQLLPLVLFTPPLFFATWLNLAGLPTAAAGLTSAWSGLYALMALRRRGGGSAVNATGLRRFGMRGMVRGAAVGLGVVNCVAGGWRYATGDFEKDEEERVKRNRWGSS